MRRLIFHELNFFRLTYSKDVSSKLKAADTEFRSNDYLQEVEQPTLILHSEDDPIVPSALGKTGFFFPFVLLKRPRVVPFSFDKWFPSSFPVGLEYLFPISSFE